MDTKQVLKCQFNPEDLPRTRSVNYANIVSPGMAYPLVQFVNGEAEDMDINLTFYNASDTKPSFFRFFNPLRINSIASSTKTV